MDELEPEEPLASEPMESTADLTEETHTPLADAAREEPASKRMVEEGPVPSDLETEAANQTEETPSAALEEGTAESHAEPEAESLDVESGVSLEMDVAETQAVPEAEVAVEAEVRAPAPSTRLTTGVPFRSRVPSDISAEPAWYVIHFYSRYEKTLR